MSVLSREGHRLRHSPGSDLGCGGLYKAFGDYQITATEFLVLIVVADKPGVSQADLAQAPDVERSRFVPTVNKLEKRGLAKRIVFAGDGPRQTDSANEAGPSTRSRLEEKSRRTSEKDVGPA